MLGCVYTLPDSTKGRLVIYNTEREKQNENIKPAKTQVNIVVLTCSNKDFPKRIVFNTFPRKTAANLMSGRRELEQKNIMCNHFPTSFSLKKGPGKDVGRIFTLCELEGHIYNTKGVL